MLSIFRENCMLSLVFNFSDRHFSGRCPTWQIPGFSFPSIQRVRQFPQSQRVAEDHAETVFSKAIFLKNNTCSAPKPMRRLFLCTRTKVQSRFNFSRGGVFSHSHLRVLSVFGVRVCARHTHTVYTIHILRTDLHATHTALICAAAAHFAVKIAENCRGEGDSPLFRRLSAMNTMSRSVLLPRPRKVGK